MNKLKTFKYKTGHDATGSTKEPSLFDKLSKRYSTAAFLRKSSGRKNGANSQPISGSYDMNGRESDDHKLEIGAPVLISKTTIDADTMEARAREYKEREEHRERDEELDGDSLDGRNDVKPTRSKSATNLHKTQLSIYLERAPSIEINDQPNGATSNIREFHSTDQLSALKASDLNASRSSFVNSMLNEDFDLKSASYQSLDGKNLYLSIDELNDITTQIRETSKADLEYCQHRDNLHPNERRVTLLRNKTSSRINLSHKKEKLSSAWSGFKVWFGEEKTKLKEVVHRQAAMQRVGALNGTPALPSTSKPTETASGRNSIVKNQDFFDRIRVSKNSADESSTKNESQMNCDNSSSIVGEVGTHFEASRMETSAGSQDLDNITAESVQQMSSTTNGGWEVNAECFVIVAFVFVV